MRCNSMVKKPQKIFIAKEERIRSLENKLVFQYYLAPRVPEEGFDDDDDFEPTEIEENDFEDDFEPIDNEDDED